MDIIIPHTNADLDALGAAVGAQVLYPRAVIVLPGPPNGLAGAFLSLHRYALRVRNPRDVDLEAVTRAIVVDTADPARLGPLQAVVERPGVEVHLYDHHPEESDDLPAALCVRDIVGATCTIIAELIEEAGAPISAVQATALLLGIYADTSSLSLLGTTDRDARAAAFLLSRGASLQAVTRFKQAALTPAQQALLDQLQAHSRWLSVRGVRIRLVEAETPEYVGGLALVVHKLQEILPAPALFAAVRMADRVHLVGRSSVPWVDVARVMSAFGGGGHPAAASAVAKGVSVSEAVARLESALTAAVGQQVTARHVMSAPVKTVRESIAVREAERLMFRYGHSGLPVVDDGGRLVGMISLRDAEQARRHGLEHAPVKGLMVRRVLTVGPDVPIDEVQELMVRADIGRVPVCEGGSLVGIISRSDLLGQLYGGAPPHWHRTLYAGGEAEDGDAAAERVRKAMDQVSPAVRDLLRTAGAVAEQQLGTSAFAVGGFVRDLLLGRPNLDIDIVVEGDGLAYARALAATLGGTVKEVPRFGTAHIYTDPQSDELPHRIDVATARREFYEHAAALPLVELANLREDLYRRDFSINALAVRLGAAGPGGLVDFFGGLPDLQEGRIRILHSLSFVEDPTRILRAVRFASRYGFALEPETARCARAAIADGFLDRVSADRLRNELMLMLHEPDSQKALAALNDLGVLERVLPGIRADDDRLGQVEALAAAAPDLYQAAKPWLLKLMLMLHPLPLPEGVKLAHRLKLRKEDAQALLHALTCWRLALDVALSAHAARGEVVRALTGWSPEGLLLLHLLGAAGAVDRYWHEWRHVRLAIDGNDLVRAGVPAGRSIGRALSLVMADLLDGLAPDRDTQLALALRYANEEE